MHGLRAKCLLDACVHARRSLEDYVEEAQVGEGVIKWMLVLAPHSASDFGATDFFVAAERSLHVTHHAVILAVVKRMHRVLVQKVERLQKSRAGGQQDGEQDF